MTGWTGTFGGKARSHGKCVGRGGGEGGKGVSVALWWWSWWRWWWQVSNCSTSSLSSVPHAFWELETVLTMDAKGSLYDRMDRYLWRESQVSW